jgi:FkbM family methyltransferase
MAGGPRYAQQTLTLVWTLLDLAAVPAASIVVHALSTADAATRRQLDALGIETRDCPEFAPGHPHCNKLRQLEDARVVAGEPVVFSDTDVAFVRNVEDAMPKSGAAAKVVDLPNPPWAMWQRVLAAAGLSEPASLIHTSFGEHTTPHFNCNGGLYLLQGSAGAALADAWPRWARWLIDRPELLPDGFTVHIDQVAFGLAVHERSVSLDLLSLADNYPTHGAVDSTPDLEPRVIHYHDHLDSSGFLEPVGLARVDAAIARVNQVVAARRRAGFDNATFWNFRYHSAPGLGSGLGSRGESLVYKRSQLAHLVDAGASVLDVGCGDLEVSRELATDHYTGVDLSREALEIARTKRPEWTFVEGQLGSLDLDAHDTVICFDVLIHQRTPAAYRTLVADLVRLAGRRLIVGAYDAPPTLTSEITFYHEPVTTSLARWVGTEAITIAGGYRDAALVVVDLAMARTDAIARLRRTRRFETVHGPFVALDDDLIAGHFRSFRAHTRNEVAMILSLLRPGDEVIDVGAHIGTFAVPLARAVGRSGRLLVVEPDAFNADLLYRNLALGGVDERIEVVEGIAVGPDGRVRPEPSEGNTGAWRYVSDSSGPFRTLPLDTLAAEHRIVKPVLVKVDVEGAELGVLQSSVRLLDEARPMVYCEVSAEQLGRFDASVEALDAFLTARRYQFFRNAGERNSDHDRFAIAKLSRLSEGGPFFDVLAIPAERVAEFVDAGRLPAGAR